MENKNSMKRTFPADAANIFVRNLLCDMSEELGGFKEHDWKKTLKYFDKRCAYTGVKLSEKKTVIDHLIAHNRQECGLHLYGNLIPATREANAAKSNKTFEDFLMNNTSILGDLDIEIRQERIAKIKEFQIISGYFEKLEKLKNIISLHDFVKFQYESIYQKVEENKREFSGYLKEQALENVTIPSKSGIVKDINYKLELWSAKPYLNVHKIIALVLDNENICKEELIAKIQDLEISKNPTGAIASLMSDVGNNYGRVIQEVEGQIEFCPEVKEKINSYKWNVLLS
jgi:hypothetical protein